MFALKTALITPEDVINGVNTKAGRIDTGL